MPLYYCNDFRAVEAGIHAYASRNGKYSSLSLPKLKMVFLPWLKPLALGTVGGLTSLHPLVKLSLEMLEKPSAINAAVAGLSKLCCFTLFDNNWNSEGHMKMHLNNIINLATDAERLMIQKHFKKIRNTQCRGHLY
jgi:hydroxymethylglutaryl-CoA reductase